MNGNVIETIIRRVGLVALAGVVGFGIWRASETEAKAFEKAESRLIERIEEYIALRFEDDQPAIYAMTDPEQRKIKKLQTWLEFHGAGVLEILEMEWENLRVDELSRTAKVTLQTHVELQPNKLPPPFNEVDEEHPEHLRKKGSEELEFVWREGEWYLRMDRTFVTGKAPDGREIKPFKQK